MPRSNSLRGCPKPRATRSFQFGGPPPNDGANTIRPYDWISMHPSPLTQGTSFDPLELNTPAQGEGDERAEAEHLLAAIEQVGPPFSERFENARDGPPEDVVTDLHRAVGAVDDPTPFRAIEHLPGVQDPEVMMYLTLSTLSSDKLWVLLAAAVHVRAERLIQRLALRLSFEVVDASARTVRWFGAAGPGNDNGVTPAVLARLCGLQGDVDVEADVAAPFASAVGYLLLRCRRPAFCLALVNAVLHTEAFGGAEGAVWKRALHSPHMRHMLAVCVLIAMDCLFSGTWYMYDGEGPLPPGETLTGRSRDERRLRYRRWTAFCDVAIDEIIGEAMPDMIVLRTDTGAGRAKGGSALLAQTGVTGFGTAPASAASSAPSEGRRPRHPQATFRSTVVPTLRIAIEASRVHDWPYEAMMRLPAATFSADTLYDTFVHLYKREPVDRVYTDVTEEEPAQIGLARRTRFLELTYSKLIALSHDPNVYHRERRWATLRLQQLWRDLAQLEPHDASNPRLRGQVRFERLVRRLLQLTPAPDPDLVGTPSATACDVVFAMSHALDQAERNEPCKLTKQRVLHHAARVYLDAIVDLAESDVRFLRAAKVLADVGPQRRDESFLACALRVHRNAEAKPIPAREARRVFDLVLAVGRETFGAGIDQEEWDAPLTDAFHAGLGGYDAEAAEAAAASLVEWQKRVRQELVDQVQWGFLVLRTEEESEVRADNDELIPKLLALIECLDWAHDEWSTLDERSVDELWRSNEYHPWVAPRCDDALPAPDHTKARHGSFLACFIVSTARPRGAPRETTPRVDEAHDADTRTGMQRLLRFVRWSEREAQWALATAGVECNEVAAELLQQPFPNHPLGVRPDAVPDWMIERALANSRILGSDCHFGYADEVREWLVEVAEPLWSAGGAATASLGVGMKRKRKGAE